MFFRTLPIISNKYFVTSFSLSKVVLIVVSFGNKK